MKTKIDNFDLIRPLLSFKNKGEFYYLQLLKRKVDGTTKYNNTNNSARLVNRYFIYDVDTFDERKKEITAICELLKCRAYIHLNKMTDEVVTKESARRLLDAVISENYHTTRVLESIAGGHLHTKERKIFIDMDTKDKKVLRETIAFINQLQPVEKTNKIIAILPSYKGFHLVCENFRKDHFGEYCQGKDISFEGNLVALYYPQQD